jgi:hypothetical protein
MFCTGAARPGQEATLADEGEARLNLSVVRHRLEEHAERANPHASGVVERPIENHGLQGLAVAHNAYDFVLTALVVAVAAQRDGWQGRKITHAIAAEVRVEGWSALTFELSGRHRCGAARRIIDNESLAATRRWRSALERRVRPHFAQNAGAAGRAQT